MFKKKKDVVYMYNGILLNHKKEWKFDICSNMDGLGSIMLSEISQKVKGKYHSISIKCPE